MEAGLEEEVGGASMEPAWGEAGSGSCCNSSICEGNLEGEGGDKVSSDYKCTVHAG